MGSDIFTDFSYYRGPAASFRLEKSGKIVYMVLGAPGFGAWPGCPNEHLEQHAESYGRRRIVALKLDRVEDIAKIASVRVLPRR